MLSSLKKFLFERNLKKRLSEKPKSKTFSFHSAQKIAILYDGRNPQIVQEIKALKDRIKEESKTFKTLAFIEKIEDTVHITCPIYSSQLIDWMGIPDSREVEDLIRFKADLFIVINPEKLRHFNYVLALSHANIKAGVAQGDRFDRYYNLLIDPNELRDHNLSYTQIYDIFSKLGIQND